MESHIEFDLEMIQRYDRSGPRYTSYPTAVSFEDDFTERSYKSACIASNEDLIPAPLSLYIHIPFCDTVCFYCACNKIVTKHHRRAAPYLQRLHQEIELQGQLFDRDREVLQLHFGGGTPTFLDDQEITDVIGKIQQEFNAPARDDKDFSIEIDPRSVTPKRIELLGQLGFNRFSLGVQDVDPIVQKAVNRVQSTELTHDIINACRDSGSQSVNIDLIYGLPHQTASGFAQALDAVIEMDPDRLSIFNYAHLPTIFKPQRRIDVGDLPSPKEKLLILQNTIKQLSDAGYVYIGMDHFAKPNDELVIARDQNELHRNFQGYTTHGHCDLIGLGVSAISSVRGVYSQNAKDEASYSDGIDKGTLPVIRGIASSLEDRLRWHVIQRLSCYNHVDKAQVSTQFQINFDQHFRTELAILKPMQADGLIYMDDKTIQISPKGRLLTRNVCMVFDEVLNQITNSAQQPRYSRAI